MTFEAAFPSEPVQMQDGSTVLGSYGMSLRDYFAAKAMQALMGNREMWVLVADPKDLLVVAEKAYGAADAMMAVRDKRRKIPKK